MSDVSIDRLKLLWTRTVREGDYSVVVLDVVGREDRVFATLQTIQWIGDAVNDIREQEVLFGWIEDFDDDARNAAMVEAWVTVLREVLGSMRVETFVDLMPADFVSSDLAHLSTCTTQQHFEKALRAKKRLGAYLPAAS